MGVVQLPDDTMRTIEQCVAGGQAMNPATFVQEAVPRLFEDADAEQDDIERAACAGRADAEAGRVTTIATPADEQALHDRLMDRLRSSLLAGE